MERAGACLGSQGVRAAWEAPPPPGAGFEVSAGAEGDDEEEEDGCHEQGRAGILHRAEPRARGQGRPICVRGRCRQLKGILRHFETGLVSPQKGNPLFWIFPPPHILQTLKSEDNVFLRVEVEGWVSRGSQPLAASH